MDVLDERVGSGTRRLYRLASGPMDRKVTLGWKPISLLIQNKKILVGSTYYIKDYSLSEALSSCCRFREPPLIKYIDQL